MPSPADWAARHSPAANARRTAALLNTLSHHPDDSPATVTALADVLRAFGELDPITLAPADLPGLRAAARLLRAVFAAPDTDAAAERLNILLADHTSPLRLTTHSGSAPWHPHLDSHDDAPWPEWFVTSSGLALAVLLWDRQRAPGAVCAAAGCRDVFIGNGTGVVQRYCSRRCATRERVAAHRRGRQEEAAGGGAAVGSGGAARGRTGG